jgi:hypothetical protein
VGQAAGKGTAPLFESWVKSEVLAGRARSVGFNPATRLVMIARTRCVMGTERGFLFFGIQTIVTLVLKSTSLTGLGRPDHVDGCLLVGR